MAQESGGGFEGPQQQHLPGIMRKAAEHVKSHPYRIHDAASAQEVPYVGPQLAGIIVKNLFREYPAEPPSEEELEERRAQKAALKQQQVALGGRTGHHDSTWGTQLARWSAAAHQHCQNGRLTICPGARTALYPFKSIYAWEQSMCAVASPALPKAPHQSLLCRRRSARPARPVAGRQRVRVGVQVQGPPQ